MDAQTPITPQVDQPVYRTCTEEDFQRSLGAIKEGSVFRAVSVNETNQNDVPDEIKNVNSNWKYPTIGAFLIKEKEPDLSLNWDRFICEDNSFVLLSLSGKGDGFKDPNTYSLYRFPYQIIEECPEVVGLMHTPWFQGNLSPERIPNNYSHCSAYTGPAKNQKKVLATTLRIFCLQQENSNKIEYDSNRLERKISELRDKQNNTPYHSCCIFKN